MELGDVSPNCVVTSAPPATVVVADDQAIDSLRFTVACAYASGAITVHTDVADSLATGPFRVVADGTDSRLLGGHDTTTFSDLADGTHTVVLTAQGALKLPQFCVLPPDSVRVRVSGGARIETTIPLAMGCCGLPFGCD